MGDFDELKNSLDHLHHKLKSFAGFINRKRVPNSNPESKYSSKRGSMTDEFTYMFDDLYDNGWKVTIHDYSYYIKIYITNALKIKNAESEFDNLLNTLLEIKDRLTDEGFNTHFMIFFSGLGQQDNNPITYKNDLYSYKGIGDKDNLKYYYDPSKYPSDEYFYANVELILI